MIRADDSNTFKFSIGCDHGISTLEPHPKHGIDLNSPTAHQLFLLVALIDGDPLPNNAALVEFTIKRSKKRNRHYEHVIGIWAVLQRICSTILPNAILRCELSVL